MRRLKITNDRLADIDVGLIDDNPFVLVGTAAHIADQIAAHRERWGFTSFVARVSDLTDLATVTERMT